MLYSSKKHVSRLDRKMTFDFAGRRIVEDFESKNAVFDEHEFLQSLKVEYKKLKKVLILTMNFYGILKRKYLQNYVLGRRVFFEKSNTVRNIDR